MRKRGGLKLSLQGSWVPRATWTFNVYNAVNSSTQYINLDTFCAMHTKIFKKFRLWIRASFLGVQSQIPIADGWAMADLLWRVKPDLLIEIGTNTGASALFMSMIMKSYNPNAILLTLDRNNVTHWAGKEAGRSECGGCTFDSAREHPMWTSGGIKFIQGDIRNTKIRSQVQSYVDRAKVVVAIEDATHGKDTYDRIKILSQWVTVGSYMQVQDVADFLPVRHATQRYIDE